MILILLGASGTGKSMIERKLVEQYDFEKIIPFTTRTIRQNEINGRDYYFVSNSEFEEILSENQFAQYDEYSQHRLYGTLKDDYYTDDGEINRVVVLTPSGYRQLQKNIDNHSFFAVLITANLGTRIKRYIDRCGVKNFTYDDKNEIAARVERDFGAFMGIENEVDFVIENNEGTDIDQIVNDIIGEFTKIKEKK